VQRVRIAAERIEIRVRLAADFRIQGLDETDAEDDPADTLPPPSPIAVSAHAGERCIESPMPQVAVVAPLTAY